MKGSVTFGVLGSSFRAASMMSPTETVAHCFAPFVSREVARVPGAGCAATPQTPGLASKDGAPTGEPAAEPSVGSLQVGCEPRASSSSLDGGRANALLVGLSSVHAAMAAAAGIDATTSAGRELRLELATILARNGNERAFEFLEDSRPKDCEQVGLIFANAGNLPAVMRAANCADSRGYVSSVIRTLAKAGKYGDIRRLAATPGFLNDEPETAATMAVAMARAGAGGEALRWSAKLKDESAVRTMAAAAAILPENDPNRFTSTALVIPTRGVGVSVHVEGFVVGSENVVKVRASFGCE